MARYKVLVTETFQTVVAVEAPTEADAHQRVHDAWTLGEFRLDVEDFRGVEFFVAGDADGSETKIDRKE